MLTEKNSDDGGVLVDCDMPEMDDCQTTQEQSKREQASESHLPVIAMTANEMKEDRERCLAAGMVDHMAKTIEREDFHAVLWRWQDCAYL